MSMVCTRLKHGCAGVYLELLHALGGADVGVPEHVDGEQRAHLGLGEDEIPVVLKKRPAICNESAQIDGTEENCEE